MDTRKLSLQIAQTCFQFINPKLNDYTKFSGQLSRVIKVKELENIQYSFDVDLDQIIKEKLQSIPTRVFSEESGWYETNHDYQYKVVYDPFCNSSLATKSFREAAMSISIFTQNNVWVSSLILDYQTGLIGYVESGNTTQFFQAQTLLEVNILKKSVATLADSWAVITLESLEERAKVSDLLPLISKVGRLIISSGHIYWLKLAMGVINVYADPIVGEELYEMFGATIAQGAGCKVTDLAGRDFDPSKMLVEFENNRHFSFHPVAASDATIHQELISNLQGQAL